MTTTGSKSDIGLGCVADAIESIEQDNPALPVPETIVVLSWNINGPGKAHIRNLLASQVVSDINPDVMLLQEVKTERIATIIASLCNLKQGRSYEYVNSGTDEEARVLYDSNAFELFPPQQGKRGMKLDERVKEVCTERNVKTRQGTNVTEIDVLKRRVAAVKLQHKITGKQIVFMSFHNIYSADSPSMAEKFCKIVSRTAEHEGTFVVAGADFNCDKFENGSAHIPPYIMTPRRSNAGKKKFDYFILDNNNHDVVASVSAWTVFLLVRPLSQRAYSWKDCNEALDHDPLVYEVTL